MSAGLGRKKSWRLACIALGASLLAPALVIACGDDGEPATPTCPDLPLFNIRDLEGDAATDAAKAAFEKWKAAGTGAGPCVTPPGTAVIPDAQFTGGD
jgi:hypothetical protein